MSLSCRGPIKLFEYMAPSQQNARRLQVRPISRIRYSLYLLAISFLFHAQKSHRISIAYEGR